MTPYRLHGVSCTALCVIVGLFSSATPARAQVDFPTPSAEALSTAAKASPTLVKDLAKELGSTPEQAAGAAGVIFGIAKSLLRPEDFAKMSKAVPGMDALLAAVPMAPATSGGLSAPPGVTLTPGFASSSNPGMTMAANPGMTTAPPSGMASALAAFPKLGISPEMIMKAIPVLSGYLKKHGGKDLGALLGGLFKTGK